MKGRRKAWLLEDWSDQSRPKPLPVPLADHSKETHNRAIKEAVETAVQGATAMGLSWIWGLLEYGRRHAAIDVEENGTQGGTRGLNRSGLSR